LISSHPLLCYVAKKLEEYSDPFDLKKATAEKENVESTSSVILPLSEDDYSVPYEMKGRQHQGKKRCWQSEVKQYI